MQHLQTSTRTRAAALGLALALAPAAGCGDDLTPPEDVLLDPPAPGEGVQFQMNTVIPSGTEAEHCQFVQAPGEGMFVNRDEVRFTAGSHHFLLYQTAYTEIPTRTEDGIEVDTSGVFDCSDGATNGWDVVKLIGGSQNSDGDSMLAFPPGVAVFVEPGTVLLMNAHYVNASDQDLEPEVRINLYSVPEDEVVQEGDLLFLYNPFIKVGAGSSSRARMRCPVHEDITIVNVQSHMHARGVDFAAMIGGQEPFYTNTEWEDVPAVALPGDGLRVPAGAVLDYYCDYENPESRDVFQGPRSTDEMCMLIGSYYPANLALANCVAEDLRTPAGEWVGNGDATCAASLDCVLASFGAPEVLPPLTECLLGADPAVSRPLSDVAACLFSSANPVVDCAELIGACQAQ